jgi:hypothetical protein
MLLVLLFSAAMGWCGTPYPGWWRRKKYPPPPPPDWFINFTSSDPMPGIIAGIAGGIAGGLIMNYAVSDNIAAVGLAALSGGRIVADIVNGIRGR